MADLLQPIVERKREVVAGAKARVPMSLLEERAAGRDAVRDFVAALRRPGLSVIAEAKKASPSAGVIQPEFDPVAVAKTYQAAGADAVSVLTDEDFFQGHLDYLTAIRREVELPALRKDFVIDEYQLYEALAAGADAVLLIAEILPGGLLQELYGAARRLGLHVLLELYDAEQVPRAVDTGCEVIGINNRDLRKFETRIEHTLELIGDIPPGRVVVSESGIKTADDCRRLRDAGAAAVLIGETLMRAADPAAALRELRGE